MQRLSSQPSTKAYTRICFSHYLGDLHSLRDIHPASSGSCGDCTREGLARRNDTLYKVAGYLTQLGASFPVRSGACMYKC